MMLTAFSTPLIDESDVPASQLGAITSALDAAKGADLHVSAHHHARRALPHACTAQCHAVQVILLRAEQGPHAGDQSQHIDQHLLARVVLQLLKAHILKARAHLATIAICARLYVRTCGA